MRLMRQMSAEECRLQCSFETVRQTPLDKNDTSKLRRPLAFWALPTDRRLPIALLNRTVNELLETSFEELSATPGIGQKKIHSLVELLERVTTESPFETNESHSTNGNGESVCLRCGGFDAATVSEAVWNEWCESVRRHELTDEKLGRLAPTLQSLPTVIWDTPLSFYVDHSLAEVRELKTHGEKRVGAVLRVFYEVHQILSGMGEDSALTVRPLPRFVPPIEVWIGHVTSAPEVPSLNEIREQLAEPLLDQIGIDAGQPVRQLVEGRWGLNLEPKTVRDQSRELGVTRARVYQLFDDCQKIMRVRWPDGEQQLQDLLGVLTKMSVDDERLALVQSIESLLFASPREVDEEGDT